MNRSELTALHTEAYPLVDGGWLVKTKDGRWLALDSEGRKVYGRDERVVVHRKKETKQTEELIGGDSSKD